MPLNYPSSYLAAPYGLEVQLTYNGLTLNANKTSYPGMQSAGGVYYVDDIAGLDDADMRAGAESRPDVDGENPLKSYYGGRTIVITGRVFGLNMYQLRVLQQNMREAFGLGATTEKALTFSTGLAANDVYIMCRKSAPLQMKEGNRSPAQHTVRDFMITLRASDPRFMSTTQVTVTATNPPNNTLLACLNLGNYYTYPIITIQGPFSAGLTLQNTVTGEILGIGTPLTGSDTLILDTKNHTATRGGLNAYSYLGVQPGVWPYLVPGNQNIQLGSVAGTTASSSVTVVYQHAFI